MVLIPFGVSYTKSYSNALGIKRLLGLDFRLLCFAASSRQADDLAGLGSL